MKGENSFNLDVAGEGRKMNLKDIELKCKKALNLNVKEESKELNDLDVIYIGKDYSNGGVIIFDEFKKVIGENE